MASKPIMNVTRSLPFRTQQLVPQKRWLSTSLMRSSVDDAIKGSKKMREGNPKGPNQEQASHVSEEQAAMDKIMGETPPDLQQGTPVQEILQREGAQDKAPKVMKQEMKKSSTTTGQTRSYSTSSTRRAVESELVKFEDTRAVGLEYPDAGFGHKFPLPDVQSIPRSDHLKKRYNPVVDQVTKSIMRSGKLSQAQKNMSLILDVLRTASVPQPNPQFPGRTLLLQGPRESLPLNPVQYLTTVVDSVAPLLKIRQLRGVAGGGASLPMPTPLSVRQRRRQAIQWILSSADSRREVRLADRVAKEIINVAEGKSSAWDKRALVHKLAISARSNVRIAAGRRR